MKLDISFEHVDSYDHKIGWYYLTIKAYQGTDSTSVGFMNVKYITEESFKIHYPTILHYLAKIENRFHIPKGTDLVNLENNDTETLKKLFNSLSGIQMGIDLGRDEYIIFLQEIIEEIQNSRDATNYNSFYQQYVNAPFVDYVYVNPKYRKNGYGKAIYQEAMRYLDQWGLKLHSSMIQTEDAKNVWESLKNES